MTRVLVIGLDGATFDVLQGLADKGRLPALSKLMQKGTSARLRSIFPPVTAAAWASFMTGKNPGKHGIYEFLCRQVGTLTNVPASARLMASEALWHILSRHGKRVGVMNVPLTYPHTPVNGFMLGDFLTPASVTNFGYPLALLREVEARYGDYPLFHREAYARGRAGRVLDELYRIDDYYRTVGLDLFRREDWDFFMIHFAGIDRIQHELWHLWDETHPAHDRREAALHLDRALKFFEYVDATVQQFINDDDETCVIVMSDHGFGPIHRFVNINMWLLQRGYLRLKKSPLSRLRYLLFRLGLTPALMYKLASLLGMANLRLVRGMRHRFIIIRLAERFFLSMADVDWTRTQVFSQGNYGQLYVNLLGREPYGIVPPTEHAALCEQIAADLKKLVDPLTGKPIVETIFLRDELYHGEFIEYAPDIGFLMADGYKALGTLSFTSNKVVEPVFGNSGDHRMDGILVMSGPGIRKGHWLDSASIMDVAPTVLHLLALPVEKDMDGKVLQDALTPDFRSSHPVNHVDSRIEVARQDSPFSEEEAEEIRNRLSDLGYWG